MRFGEGILFPCVDYLLKTTNYELLKVFQKVAFDDLDEVKLFCLFAKVTSHGAAGLVGLHEVVEREFPVGEVLLQVFSGAEVSFLDEVLEDEELVGL